MRLLRVLAAAFTFAALLATPSAAQEGRQFQDAWFWGVKGGVMSYSATRGTDNNAAPVVGVDWLITRSNAGLMFSFDQAFMSTTAFVGEPYTDTSPYVSLRNLRRISLAAMAFPLQTPTLHPYVGLGASLQQVGAVDLQSTIAIPALYNAAMDSIQNKKSTIAPMFIAGVQKRLPQISVFAQGTGSFLQHGFYMHHPSPKLGLAWSLEAGVRYNVGSSIDRTR